MQDRLGITSSQPLQLSASAEALAALTAIRDGLDHEAVRKVRVQVWLSFGTLLLVVAFLAWLTYKYGWDVMEPWTYFIGLAVAVGGYGYFVFTKKELSPGAIYEQLILTQKYELYRKFGFDLAAYESLSVNANCATTFPSQQALRISTEEVELSAKPREFDQQLENPTHVLGQTGVDKSASEIRASGIICREDVRITTLSVSHDGKYLSYGGFARRVSVFSLESLTYSEVTTHKETVRSVRFAPLRNAVASSTDDGVLQLNYLDEKEFRVIGRHGGAVYCLAFHPSGRLIASAGRDSFVKIWDIEKSPIQKNGSEPRSGGQPVQSFKHREGGVFSVDLDRTGNFLASCGEKGSVYIWNIEDRKPRKLIGFKETVFCVRFDPSSNLLASGGADSMVRVWDLSTGECTELLGHDGAVRWISFHPSGRLLASASKDRTIRLWELSTLKSWIMEGHTDYVYSVEFHPDGTRMYSAGGDGTIRSWDVPLAALSVII